jgi:hypothetical protein
MTVTPDRVPLNVFNRRRRIVSPFLNGQSKLQISIGATTSKLYLPCIDDTHENSLNERESRPARRPSARNDEMLSSFLDPSSPTRSDVATRRCSIKSIFRRSPDCRDRKIDGEPSAWNDMWTLKRANPLSDDDDDDVCGSTSTVWSGQFQIGSFDELSSQRDDGPSPLKRARFPTIHPSSLSLDEGDDDSLE